MVLKHSKKTSLKKSPSKLSSKSSKKSKNSKKSTKSKKSPIKKESTRPESSLQRRVREHKEKKLAEQQAKIQEEISIKKEEERKHKIIYKYMEKLDQKFKERFTNGFWLWVDKPTKVISGKGIQYFRKLISNNPEKYKNKHLAEIVVISNHKDHGKEKHLFMNKDTWISCRISIFKINNKGEFPKKPDGCNWTWRTDDFKISKFSFKLINFLLDVINKDIYTCGTLSGEPLSFMVKNMKKRGVDFGDLLQPLSNV